MNSRFGGKRFRPGAKTWLMLFIIAMPLVAPPMLRFWRAPAATTMTLHPSARVLPELAFSDGQGRPTSLAAYRGRTVLLNIWATWCTPCREEMPTLDRLQAKLDGPTFEVVALSIDKTGLPAVQAFYRSIGIRHLGIYLDSSGEAAAALVATGIPLTLLIDADGREIGRKLGPAVWDAEPMVALLRGHINTTAPRAEGASR